MSLREHKREATRRRIQAAARSLFLEQGFSETTMEQVAVAADVSRASLFNYFPGKAALLESLGQDLEQRMLETLGHYRGKHASSPQALSALFSHAAQVLEQTSGLTRLIFVQSTAGEGFPVVLQAFREMVSDAQEAGEWRRDIDARRLAELIYLEFVAGLLDWCRSGEAHAALFADRVAMLNRLLTP